MSTLYVDNLEPNLGSQVEIPDLKPLAGSVINQEIVTNSISTTVTVNALTSVWTPSYTPVSDNSDVYATFNLSFQPYRNTGADARFNYAIWRDSTEVLNANSIGVYVYGSSGNWSKLKYTDTIKHTNTSTSAITYDVKLSTQGLCVSVAINSAGTQSQVIFTEIAR